MTAAQNSATADVILTISLKGGTQIRTGGGGFADLCLTTWLCRRTDYLVYQLLPLFLLLVQFKESQIAYPDHLAIASAARVRSI